MPFSTLIRVRRTRRKHLGGRWRWLTAGAPLLPRSLVAPIIAVAIAPSSVPLLVGKAEALVGAKKYGETLVLARYAGHRARRSPASRREVC